MKTRNTTNPNQRTPQDAQKERIHTLYTLAAYSTHSLQNLLIKVITAPE